MDWFVAEIFGIALALCGLIALIVSNNVFARLGGLDRRVYVLERTLAASSVAPSAGPVPDSAFEAAEVQEVTVAPRASEAPDASDVVAEPEPALVYAARVEMPVETQRSEEPRAKNAPQRSHDPRTKIDWEVFAGGRFFNFVGAIVLIIGVGLFMKYAFDNDWIGAPLRVLVGVLAGSAAIVAAALMHEKQKTRGRAWFAEGVFGAGLGTLYVSGYAAFESFHLIPFAAAFAFMSVVTLVAFAIALWYGSVAMAIIGWAGGFVTPFAVGIDNVDEASLAAYIVCLDAGLAAIALVRRQWFGLQPLALCTSYLLAIGWYANYGQSASALVSTLAICGLWLVFFASGVIAALRESPAIAPATAAARMLVEIVNAIALWSTLAFVLAADRTAFAAVQTVAAFGYAIAFASVVRRAATRRVLRAQYLIGTAAFAAASLAAYFPHADLTAIYATIALVAGIVAYGLRDRAPRACREAAFVGLGFYAGAAIALLAVRGLTASAMAWTLAPGSRDLSLLVLAVAGFAFDRLTRRAFPSDACGIVLRQTALVCVAALEIVHVRGLALCDTFVATSIALALLERALRAARSSYAPKNEPVFASLALLALGVVGFFGNADALAPAYGALDTHAGSRDVALLLFALAAFALDRIWRIDSRTPFACGVFRGLALLSALGLESLHARELGLATAVALTSMVLIGFDRILRSVGSTYASEREVWYTAAVLLSGAWIAVVPGYAEFAYAMPGVFAGFGHADSTLVLLIASAIVLLRTIGRGVPKEAAGILRQSIAFALTLAAIKHTTGLALCATLALEALAYAHVGTRRLWRDVEIDGLAVFAIALVWTFCEPAAWQARDLGHFAILRDERGATLPIIAIAALVAGEWYRRRSLLSPWFGRSLRLAGVATIVFGLTGELRDAFERAALSASANALDAAAQIRDFEDLAVSGLWIVASIAIISLGVRLKLKDFRIAAIALFDLTILKAFFIDLGSLATPYRILSFIGLGLTLLAVSYFYQRLERGRTPAAPAGPRDPRAAVAEG